MYCIGVDHHKQTSYVTSMDAEGGMYFRGNLSADAATLTEFFANHPRPFIVGIEATYAWEYVGDIVEELGAELHVGHPLLLKAFARRHKKNDKIDSALIADLLRSDHFPRIAHPPKSARMQRDLYRQRMRLVSKRSGAIASAKALADRLGFQATMKLQTQRGVRALAALPVPEELRPVWESHVALLIFLSDQITRLNTSIESVASQDASASFLKTIPGIGPYLALLIGSEIFDINRFPNSRAFASYAGVAPSTASSGGRVYSSRLMPAANRYLRWAFGETVIHYTRACAHAKRKYERLKRAKGWKTARLATARTVATVAYHVLKEQRPYRAVLE